jgi:phosphatidylglycerophosphate synthase
LRSTFIIDYFRSLKPWETEELVNQYINRPIAYLIALGFKGLGASPNFVTLLAMCFGVSSGVFFARGDYRAEITAAMLLAVMNLLDCADGQLARILGRSSQLGKTLDGIGDFMTHLSIFFGVAHALSVKVGSFYPYFLAVAAQFSMYIHIMFYDHFKNVFINLTCPDYVDRLEDLDELKERAERAKLNGKGLSGRLLPRMYYAFYRAETAFVSIGYLPVLNNLHDIIRDPERIDPYVKEAYSREMKPVVRMWSVIGDTLHLTLFMIFGVVGNMALLFPVMIVLLNVYMVFVIVYQRQRFRKLGLEREVVWQGRFD